MSEDTDTTQPRFTPGHFPGCVLGRGQHGFIPFPVPRHTSVSPHGPVMWMCLLTCCSVQNGHFQPLPSSGLPNPTTRRPAASLREGFRGCAPTSPPSGKDGYDITALWWQGRREQLDVGWPSSNTPLSRGSLSPLSSSSPVPALEALVSSLLLVPLLLEIRAQRDESVPSVDGAPQHRAGRGVSAERGSESLRRPVRDCPRWRDVVVSTQPPLLTRGGRRVFPERPGPAC